MPTRSSAISDQLGIVSERGKERKGREDERRGIIRRQQRRNEAEQSLDHSEHPRSTCSGRRRRRSLVDTYLNVSPRIRKPI